MQPIPGAQNEIDFWKAFVKTDRFKEWCKPEPNAELQPFVYNFIREHCPVNGSILDCGSGVVSILHGLGYNLTATDVLGEHYAAMLPPGITPPIAIGAEDLPYNEQFDIVHMRNALDHCQDPITAYERLWAAVKKGGYLIIHGFEREASAENWKGMHQWDIYIDTDNELMCTGKSGTNTLDGSVSEHATTETLINGKKWMIWIVKK